MSWWKYYNFKSEPFLSLNPLTLPVDLGIFWGRTKEIREIRIRTNSQSKICLLLTGDAGIGKTTFLYKAFGEEKGFIRVNLSKARNIDEADGEIARSCILAAEKAGIKAEDLYHRLIKSTSKTTGRKLKAGIGGAGVSSVNQKTETPERNYETEDIIYESCKRMSKRNERVILVIDEPDFLEPEMPANMANLCQRMKELIPTPGLLILAHRDSKDNFSKGFDDLKSIIRSTFDHHEYLKPLWELGRGNLKDILNPRFHRGKPLKSYVYPFTDKASFLIDVLSSANYREMLRYAKYVLQEGMIVEQEVPLSEKFILNILMKKFSELRIEADDLKILKYLLKKTASVSDKQFINISKSRTTLQRRLEPLENRWLVERHTLPRTRKQVFGLTEKGKVLVNFKSDKSK